jgi:hypothetical protein
MPSQNTQHSTHSTTPRLPSDRSLTTLSCELCSFRRLQPLLLLILIRVKPKPGMSLSFAHAWQQQELSDIDIILTVPGPSAESGQRDGQPAKVELTRFPAHSILLSNSAVLRCRVSGGWKVPVILNKLPSPSGCT